MRPGRRAILGAALLALTTTAEAQTNDHFFRSWWWAEDVTSPRGAGLAGAMTAVGDDSAAAVHNPAGLASLTKAEVALGLSIRRPATTHAGDSLGGRTDVGFAAAAARLGSRFAVGGHVTEPYAASLRLSPVRLPDGLADVGSLEGVVTEVGVSAAWRATERFHVGGGIAASRLAIDGEYSREPETGPVDLRVNTTGRSTRPTGAIGAVFLPTPRLRLAVSASSGARWRAERTARSPVLGAVLDEGSAYEVRQPRTISAGISVQPSLKLMVAAQVDHVSYHDIQSGLVIGQGAHARSEYALDDAWEARGGIEASFPRRAVSLQLRAGVHWQAPGILRYEGPDPVESAAFMGGRRRTIGSVGGSFVTTRWLRFDLAGRFGGEPSQFVAGTAIRF